VSGIHVLVVEDSDDDVRLLVTKLRRGGIEVTHEAVHSADGVAHALAARPPDIVICDYNMPAFNAQDALDLVRDSGLDVPFIVVSGAVGEETAATLMKAGASDFILKGRMSRLVPAVERELREVQTRQQRRRAEAALRDSEEHFRLLAEHAQDVIFRYRVLPKAALEYVSPAVTTLTGHRPEELVADPDLLFSMVEPTQRAEFVQSWGSPRPPALVVQLRRRDGDLMWIEQRAVGVHDNAGQLVAVEGILRDITTQMLAEQERERLNQQLRQSERLDSLGRLAGGIAHDFNNLLAVIINYAADVGVALDADDPCRPDIEQIHAAANRAATLTRQLLIFSRLEPSEPETLDLNTIVTDVERLLRRTIGEDIEFRTNLEAGIQAVCVDRSKIEQVLVNLVMNARAAMPLGGRLTIETSEIDAGPDATLHAGSERIVRLSVTDDGHGMTPEVLRRAFEPFFTTKRPGEGTGIGLATAYGVVKEAGGDIRLRSEVDKGTTVTVLLPAVEPIERAIDAPAREDPHGAGQSILVVEDDEAVRGIVQRILTRGGYTMVAAETPYDALAMCHNPQTRIHALLTDVVMPEMSGLQLAERVRDIRPDLPVLLMSGYIAGSVPGAHEIADDLPLIRKPFTTATLLQAVHDVLSSP
jgi:PAS domain S-box-containing protein